MKMRTYHLEAILQFLENAAVEGETRISIGEDSYMPVVLLREAHDEIGRIDSMIDTLHRSNTDLRDAETTDLNDELWECPVCGCTETWFDRSVAYCDGVEEGPTTRCAGCGVDVDEAYPNENI